MSDAAATSPAAKPFALTDGAKVHVIANPHSAGGATSKRWDELLATINRAVTPITGLPVETSLTTGPWDAARLTTQALKNGADQIIAVGGDGTIHECINGFFENAQLINPDAVLALMPAGTGGDYRRTFGIPTDIEQAADICARGEALSLIHISARIAEMEGMPYAWPKPDPIVMDIASGEVPEDQPYIHRLTRLGVAAAEAGHGMDFLHEVSSIIFGGVKGWHEGDHLEKAVDRAGLDLPELDTRIEADPDHFEKVIEENEAAQKAAGHWGVPLMVFKGEPFFGQDRIDMLVWRMSQHGLVHNDKDSKD